MLFKDARCPLPSARDELSMQTPRGADSWYFLSQQSAHMAKLAEHHRLQRWLAPRSCSHGRRERRCILLLATALWPASPGLDPWHLRALLPEALAREGQSAAASWIQHRQQSGASSLLHIGTGRTSMTPAGLVLDPASCCRAARPAPGLQRAPRQLPRLHGPHRCGGSRLR